MPRNAIGLLALAGLLLLAGLGGTALTDRDEGANSSAAREMLERGSWLTPTLDYVPRFAKPVLVAWLTAGAYVILGVGETAARLPSALAAVATVGVQYGFARWALGEAAGFRAALVLLLSLEFVVLGRLALTDATLTLWTTVAGYAFMRGWLGEPPSRQWYALAWAAAGLAILTKGPVGLLLPLGGVLGYLVVARRLGEARRVTHPLAGLAICLLVAGPWYAAMFWTHGWDYAGRAQAETLGRVFRTVTGPGGTALFYVPVLLIGFFPWSAFLPGAVVAALRGARGRARASRRDAVLVFAAIGLVAGVVMFSIAQSRLPHYILPLFPAAAVLVAASWPATPSRLARWLLAGAGVALGLALVGARVFSTDVVRLLAQTYPTAPGTALPGVVLGVAALALAMGAMAAVRDGPALFRRLALLTAGLLVVVVHGAFPAFSADFVAPPGQLAAHAGQLAAPCDTVVAFGPYRPSLLFYARRRVAFLDAPDASRFAEQAAQPGRMFVVTPAALTSALPPAIAALPAVAQRGGYVLLASPDTSPGCAG